MTDLQLEAAEAQRSSVKIETNARGFAQVKVHVYTDQNPEEMQRTSQLAIETYEATVRSLGARADFTAGQ